MPYWWRTITQGVRVWIAPRWICGVSRKKKMGCSHPLNASSPNQVSLKENFFFLPWRGLYCYCPPLAMQELHSMRARPMALIATVFPGPSGRYFQMPSIKS
jgi:hypothetical protein